MCLLKTHGNSRLGLILFLLVGKAAEDMLVEYDARARSHQRRRDGFVGVIRANWILQPHWLPHWLMLRVYWVPPFADIAWSYMDPYDYPCCPNSSCSSSLYMELVCQEPCSRKTSPAGRGQSKLWVTKRFGGSARAACAMAPSCCRKKE